MVVETVPGGEEGKGKIFHLLTMQGYSYLDSVGGDHVFVKLEDGGSCDKPRDNEILSRSGSRYCDYYGLVSVDHLADHCTTFYPQDYFGPLSVSTAPGPLYWVSRVLITREDLAVLGSWVASVGFNLLVEVFCPKSQIYRAVIKLM